MQQFVLYSVHDILNFNAISSFFLKGNKHFTAKETLNDLSPTKVSGLVKIILELLRMDFFMKNISDFSSFEYEKKTLTLKNSLPVIFNPLIH